MKKDRVYELKTLREITYACVREREEEHRGINGLK